MRSNADSSASVILRLEPDGTMSLSKKLPAENNGTKHIQTSPEKSQSLKSDSNMSASHRRGALKDSNKTIAVLASFASTTVPDTSSMRKGSNAAQYALKTEVSSTKVVATSIAKKNLVSQVEGLEVTQATPAPVRSGHSKTGMSTVLTSVNSGQKSQTLMKKKPITAVPNIKAENMKPALSASVTKLESSRSAATPALKTEISKPNPQIQVSESFVFGSTKKVSSPASPTKVERRTEKHSPPVSYVLY